MSLLQDKKIIIKPVEENVAGWIEEGKDGRVRLEGTQYEWDAPLTSTGRKRLFNPAEEKEMEELLNPTRPKGWLNPYAKIPGVWIGKGRFKLTVPAEGVTLDLQDPEDVVRYRIALACKDDISPSFKERLDRKYMFYMESTDTLSKDKEEKIDKTLRATDLFGEIKESKDKLYSFLLVFNNGRVRNIPMDAKLRDLRIKVFEIMQDRIDMFINILTDEEYKYRVMYYRALLTGAFEKAGGEIRASYSNGKTIGRSMTDAVEYIKELEDDTKDQAEYVKFINRIKDN